jgi:DNA-damage-inducible protein J
MSKDAYIHTRIDPDIKQQAELIFEKIGLSLTDAVSLFLTQVTLRDGLPFALSIPSEDMAYQKEKNALLAAQKAKLSAMIQTAKDEVAAGQTLSPEEAKAITKQHLKQLRNRHEASNEPTK